jgi:hypothetical protein
MADQIISKWNDKRLRLGWTIRLNNGKIAKITWMDGKTYTAKVIETVADHTRTTEPEQSTS